MNWELPDVQAGFSKDRDTRDQIANIQWIIKKQENSRKTSISASLTMPKASTVWITTNCGLFLKRWEYQSTLPASWKTCVQDKKQQLEQHMEKQIGSEFYIKAVYCHSAYLIYMKSTLYEMLGWMTCRLESRLLGEISTITNIQKLPL